MVAIRLECMDLDYCNNIKVCSNHMHNVLNNTVTEIDNVFHLFTIVFFSCLLKCYSASVASWLALILFVLLSLFSNSIVITYSILPHMFDMYSTVATKEIKSFNFDFELFKPFNICIV